MQWNERERCSSLMTVFLIVLAVRKQNWNPKFWFYRYTFQKRIFTLSWSDENTLIPVNNYLLASAKDTNIIGFVKNFDNRTLTGKWRKLVQTKAPEAMLTLLATAVSDSWFSNPTQSTAIKAKDIVEHQRKLFSEQKTPWKLKISIFCWCYDRKRKSDSC